MKSYKSGRVISFDGTEIRYTAKGEGMVLIPCNGIVCTTTYWHYLEEHFQGRCRVITWDYRGHGKSGPPADLKNLSLGCHARDLLAVMDDDGVDKAILLGHSMGVQTIFEFYRQFKDRVLGLVPVCGAYGKPFSLLSSSSVFERIYPRLFDRWAARSERHKKWMRPLLLSPLAFPFAKLVGVDPYLCPRREMDEYFRHIADMDFKVFFIGIKETGLHTAEEVLPTIDVPTLIVAGENDSMTPVYYSEDMHRRIPGSELLVIPHGQHTALIEQPQLLCLRLEIFLRDHFHKEFFGEVKKKRKKSPRKDTENHRVGF